VKASNQMRKPGSCPALRMNTTGPASDSEIPRCGRRRPIGIRDHTGWRPRPHQIPRL